MAIPIVAFAAWSGTGKTTLIEHLIPPLKAAGLRLAVIKHAAHGTDAGDGERDSDRFVRAGADRVILSGPGKDQPERSLQEILAEIRDVDLILAEGYKNEPLPQIGLARAPEMHFPSADLHRYLAVVTDEEIPSPVPCFAFDDINGITQFLLTEIVRKTACD